MALPLIELTAEVYDLTECCYKVPVCWRLSKVEGDNCGQPVIVRYFYYQVKESHFVWILRLAMQMCHLRGNNFQRFH